MSEVQGMTTDTSVGPTEHRSSRSFGKAARLARLAVEREAVWPAELAVGAAILLYAVLPGRLLLGPRPLIPGLELSLVLVIRWTHRRRSDKAIGAAVSGAFLCRHTMRDLKTRGPCLSLIVLISTVNAGTLLLLAEHLLYHAPANGRQLLFGAVCIWVTNVLVFALWYWETDRGALDRSGQAVYDDKVNDFLFPQEEKQRDDFHPKFVDYLFLAFTNATAFSPTDAMPITPKAKLAMMAQSGVSLLTVLLVTARAVNILA